MDDWFHPAHPLNPLHPIHDTHTKMPTREHHSIKDMSIKDMSIKVDGTILAVTFGLIGALILAGVMVKRSWRRRQ